MKRHAIVLLLACLLLLPGCFGGGRKDENVNKDADRPVPEKPVEKKGGVRLAAHGK
jgi:hypothetical protein